MRSLAIAWNDLLTRIEAALIRVTRFTADASHELRNPIAYIRTAAEYSLSTVGLDEESRESFRTIAEEASLTGTLLEDLLILAHPEERPTSAELEPVGISLATEALIRHFARLAQKKTRYCCSSILFTYKTSQYNSGQCHQVHTREKPYFYLV